VSSSVEDEGGVGGFREGGGGCLEGVGNDGFVRDCGVEGRWFGGGVVFGLWKEREEGKEGRERERGGGELSTLNEESCKKRRRRSSP